MRASSDEMRIFLVPHFRRYDLAPSVIGARFSASFKRSFSRVYFIDIYCFVDSHYFAARWGKNSVAS